MASEDPEAPTTESGQDTAAGDNTDEFVMHPENPSQAEDLPDVPSFGNANNEPMIAGLEDHFTLPTKSNLVRFRQKQNAARVYDEGRFQTVLEETYDPTSGTSKVAVKRMVDGTYGTTILRISYSIVCALWTGFFFTFCLQVLLFLVLDLAVESGATELNASVNVGNIIGVVLAMITMVHAFTEALVIAGHYIADTWSGHFLAKQFVFKKLSETAVDWVFFFFFLLCPLLVMCATLFMKLDNWWEVTAITWFTFVLAFYILFCLNVVYYEVRAAYELCQNRGDTDQSSWKDVVKRCILLRQVHNYCGIKKASYLAKSIFSTTEDTEDIKTSQVYEESRQETFSLWTRLTKTYMSSFFKELDRPKRLYSIEDVQDYRPFFTKNTWSLERVFCRPANSRYIAIIDGPGALTRAQFRSSFVCSLIGTILIVLCFISLLVWFDISGVFVLLAFIVVMLAAGYTLRTTCLLAKLHKDLIGVRTTFKKKAVANQPEGVENSRDQPETPIPDGGENPHNQSRPPLPPSSPSLRAWADSGKKPSEALYIVQEYKRVTEPQEKFCYAMFFLEIVFFFIWPAITLFMVSWNIAILFLIVAVVSGIRHYINVKVVIEETGNLNNINGDTAENKWENKSRLNTIVDAISNSRTKLLWMSILGVGGFAFLAIFLGAVGSSTENTGNEFLTFLPDFSYPPQSDDMRYATCTLTNIRGGFGDNAMMMDYIFLASLAYVRDNITDVALNTWFGEGVAINEEETVDTFRAEYDEGDTPVYFKLFNFPDIKLGIISIRGTSNNWDMLADSQLWSAAALMQGVRFFLPAGEIWTPILNEIVFWINRLQGEALDKISFYRLTTQFANYLKNDTEFNDIQVTGHSLGGGLAMITGAQASIPAVGVSGPNALISGRSLDPPVTSEQMNQYTFNIVPRRDIVPMLDDKADQFQYIRCESAMNDFVGCHFSKRSLCEVQYTCGTNGRPAICECVTEYGYPKPTPINGTDRTFEAACGLS